MREAGWVYGGALVHTSRGEKGEKRGGDRGGFRVGWVVVERIVGTWLLEQQQAASAYVWDVGSPLVFSEYWVAVWRRKVVS